MNRSSFTNSDGRGRTISGVTVVTGLVLLVFAGAGLAVAMYLALGPYSLRRHAVGELAAERARQADPTAEPDHSVTAPRIGNGPPVGDARTPAPATGATVTQTPNDQMAVPSTASTEADVSLPGQVLDSHGIPLTELSPLEIEGIGANAGDWRGSLKIDRQIYKNTVLLQPAENESVAQIAFALTARYARLAGFVALVAEESPDAAMANQDEPQALFRLYADGNLLWESGVLEGAGARREFECELHGADVLTLVGERQTPASVVRFAWGNLRLLPATKAVPGTERR